MDTLSGRGGTRQEGQRGFAHEDDGLQEGNEPVASADIPAILAAKINSLPSLPAVVTQVIELLADPKSTVLDLNKIISSDISLTATILKVANSAFFGFTRKVSSLEHALKILGYTEIRNLVLTKIVFNSFRNVKSSRQFDVRRFWEHAFVCGLAARLVGKTFGVKGTDTFVAGLIHDIGKLVLYTALPVQLFELLDAMGTAALRTSCAEKNLFGYAHDKIGMDLLQRWMFPKSLIAAVGFHHRPTETTGYRLLATVVYLADLLAHLNSQHELIKDDPSLIDELLRSDTIALCRSQGLEWNDSVCRRLQERLVECKEEERATIGVFFS